ncbi:hypothetical protein [Mesorhizobium sp.]|uniref:hypothetical protein n=1 Tax=Mesorhizobium sp. TaxID=1871066 RepID=UPI0025BE9AB9|nr:hypothetical protein [Mesorhizobium sp.]
MTQRSDRGGFSGRKEAFLAVWGARLGQASFRAEIEHRMVEDEKAGWKLTYRRVTPRWASYSGINNGQIRYVRAIAVCNDSVPRSSPSTTAEPKKSPTIQLWSPWCDP